MSFKEKCPTCGTQCDVTWQGLELVENTGDETLASKSYKPEHDPEFLMNTLHMDQTGLAAGLATVNKIVQQYQWVTEGRGPYAWNDEKYKEEMGNMLTNIGDAATKALNNSGALAHSVCCQRSVRTVTMEDIGYIKKDVADKELMAEREKYHKTFLDLGARLGDAIQALTNLVELKNMKDEIENPSTSTGRIIELQKEYENRKPLAWALARKITGK